MDGFTANEFHLNANVAQGTGFSSSLFVWSLMPFYVRQKIAFIRSPTVALCVVRSLSSIGPEVQNKRYRANDALNRDLTKLTE